METLAARIARAGPLPARDAVGWVIRLAKRVERLHGRGTVHGRLSAACVVMEGEPCASSGWLSDPLATPAFVGYRSPERAAGEGPSRRDDTWALAVTLYVALSGKLPFPAESDRELRRLQGAGAAPRVTPAGEEGDALWRVLEQALARDARERIVEVAALRRALEAARSGDGLEELPPLDEHPLAEPARTVPAPRPSSSGLRGASSSQPPPRRSAPPRESSGGSQPPRRSAPPGESSGGSQPPRRSAPPGESSRGSQPPRRSAPPGESPGGSQPPRRSAPPGESPGGSQPPRRSVPPGESPGGSQPPRRSAPPGESPGGFQPPRWSPPPRGHASSLPPHGGGATARRTPIPLHGLATLGLRPTAGAPTTPVPEAPDRPVNAPPASPPGPSELASASPAGASSSPPAPAGSPARVEPPAVWPAAEPPSISPALLFSAAGDDDDEPESPPPLRAVAVPLFAGDEVPPTPSKPFALAPASDVARVRAPGPGAPRAPAAAPRPRRERPSGARRIAALVLCAVVLAGAAAAAWLWLRHRDAAMPPPPVPALPAAPAACATPAEPGAPPAASAAAHDAASAATQDAAAAAPEPVDAGAASAAAIEAASAEFAACMTPLFPGKSVDAATAGQMAFVCAEVDPMKGVAALKSHLAQAAGPTGISDATKEWGVLRWYDMAALAALRARCCHAPPPLELPGTPEGCPPLDAALNDLGAAVSSASAPDDRAVAKAARRYTRTVQCIVRVGAASHYGRKNNPNGGEARALKKVLARALQDAAPRR
ncbi:hypothetical protein WME76_37645 [Sorangium sp. So ce119]|uniref:hypothetical protein n=1 Tax=Sorangium sp. So ce119 TaxID=3133279 RepID=UPI003F63DF59